MNKFNTDLNEILINKFNVTLEDVHNLLDEIIPDFSNKVRGGEELFLLYATSLLKSGKEPKNILEIGTGLGKTTNCLSHLFPNSHIHTIDLPLDDENFDNVAFRRTNKNGRYEDKIIKFEENLDRPNITTHLVNTFMLPTLDLPETFDLIWLDAGHEFPEMAWDTMYAYHRLSKDGDLFFHDYSITDNVTAVRPTIEYIEPIIKEDIEILPSTKKISTSKIAWIRK